MKDYLGRDVTCTCGEIASTLVEQHTHDGTTCQVFKCEHCGMRVHVHHVPQPDPEMAALLYSEEAEGV